MSWDLDDKDIAKWKFENTIFQTLKQKEAWLEETHGKETSVAGAGRAAGEVVEIGPQRKTCVMLCSLCMKLGEWIHLRSFLAVSLTQTCFNQYYQIFDFSDRYWDTGMDDSFKISTKVNKPPWTLMTSRSIILKSPHCFRKI